MYWTRHRNLNKCWPCNKRADQMKSNLLYQNYKQNMCHSNNTSRLRSINTLICITNKV